MRYLLIAGLLTMCLAAGSGQTVENNAQPALSDTLIAEIKEKADSLAIDAAYQIDSILDSKKLYPGKEEYIKNWFPKDSTWRWYKYISYYRVIDNDSLFVEVKINRIK